MDVYLLSGLGADKRIFSKLDFPEHCSIHHIEWIPPVADESLKDYSRRLTAQIEASKQFVLAGVSFGGIIAIEIARHLRPQQVILISSISDSRRLPWYYKLAGKLRLQKLIPIQIFKSASFLSYWLFGMKSSGEKSLLKQILHDTDGRFLGWAIEKILQWDNKEKPKRMLHIHGTSDKILPASYVKPDIIIPGGGHLMVYTHHQLLSKILSDKIKQ